ncbi:MAG: hypothetical protein R3C68_07630 [Myxococcota bacterium]
MAPKIKAAVAKDAELIDARGLVAMPGLVQAHVHLCQSLLRGLADDMELLDWLRTRIWPLEGGLTPSICALQRASVWRSLCWGHKHHFGYG